MVLPLLILATLTLGACGGGSGSSSTTGDGAAELAHQRELAQARHQGAQAARQAARIKNLEREVHAVREDARKSPTPAPQSAPVPPDETARNTSDWPDGSGYTAILASVSTEAEARSIQTEATGKGLDAGVLFSSDYSSLRPDYWVVFSGVFPSANDAEGRVEHAHELGYSDAYPRFVSP